MKIYVKAYPKSRLESVERADEESFKVYIKEPPEKGKSNRAIIKLLARHFNVPSSRVKILAGHTARNKIIEIIGL